MTGPIQPVPDQHVDPPPEPEVPKCLGYAEACIVDLGRVAHELSDDQRVNFDVYDFTTWNRTVAVLEAMVEKARDG